MNWETTTAILGICITAIVTIAGWNVSHYLAKRREDRTREIERLLERSDKQIEEFYGPLFSLVRQIVNVFYVMEAIYNEDGQQLSDEQRAAVGKYLREDIFSPLHAEVIDILKSRMYLVHDSEVAQAFYDYLKHVTQERVQHELATKKGVRTDFLAGVPWPQDFWPEVDKGLKRALAEQQRLLQLSAVSNVR